MRLGSIFLALTLFTPLASAQLGNHPDFNVAPAPAPAPLPSNYKTILDNPDVLVMHVHYAAHEAVPMHDHPAVATMFVYLNESGPIDFLHDNGTTTHRPSTQTGAFRIAPAIAERHSVVSHSDTPSDFLRIEFKDLNFPNLPDAGKRFGIPIEILTPGISTEFQNNAITISRINCASNRPCEIPTPSERALLIPLNPAAISHSGIEGSDITAGTARWLPPSTDGPFMLRAGSHALVISFADAPAASKLPCKF